MAIRVGIRSGFSTIDTYYSDICLYEFPVELTMPMADDMLRLMDSGMEQKLLDLCGEGKLSVMSIHAPAARISNDSFQQWATPLFNMARRIGARSVTLHPDYCKLNKKAKVQQSFIDSIEGVGGGGLYSIETFVGAQRLFTPDEIIINKQPMTLDTSHVHDKEKLLEIVDTYHGSITTVHLSSVTESGQHNPIDQFCVDLVLRLQSLGWDGDIVLEYLQSYHHALYADALRLSESLGIDY